MAQPGGGQPDYAKIRRSLGPKKFVIRQPTFETRYGNKRFGLSAYAKPKKVQNSNIKLNISGSGVGPLRFTPEIVKSVPSEPKSSEKPVGKKGFGGCPAKKCEVVGGEGTGEYSIGHPCPGVQRPPRRQLKWPLIAIPDHPEY